MSEPSSKFNAQAFKETLERVAKNRDFGQDRAHPDFDPTLFRDVVDVSVSGRKIEDYRQVLEHYGLTFYPPERLPPWLNGSPRKEGEWRHNRLTMAFSDHDILTKYATPEAFHLWMQQFLTRLRAAASRIHLP